MGRLLRVDEAAALLGGISRSTLYRWARAGLVRTVPLGGRLIAIPAEEIERIVAQGVRGSSASSAIPAGLEQAQDGCASPSGAA
jgi:excisionase family DNA binding protein